MAPMTQASLSPRAWAELLLLALIWGASFLSIRVALYEIGPLWVVAWRTGLAALLLWGLAFARGWSLPRDRGTWAALAVMGALNNALPFTLMAWGQQHITTGLTSILNAGTAVWGVLLAALVLADERLTPRRAAGVGLGFAGVATAIGPGELRSLDLTSLAQLAVVAGTLSYALASVWARVRFKGLAPPVAALGMVTASALMMLPTAWIVEGSPRLALSAQAWAAILWFAGAGTALAYLLYYRVLAMAGSGNTMLVTLLIPPVAITLGWAVLGEDLSPRALMGFALLAAGLLLLNRRPARKAHPRATATPFSSGR
ncbi:DMT family transporter [Histidinibacterium aquaticum]|uniref:DMT family transporter n=1 Tax=Histidinibacterium aquaticum TaxID=2613962 RepID=A0A5J5GLQ7_9RHOB|nr:DMT family transporter [Histidinibacterium aquaticum]KAA9009221.1 DMT family transporter [Histidinibacterium aquaticum]